MHFRKCNFSKTFIFTLVLFCFCKTALGENSEISSFELNSKNPSNTQRPKIGLVLSGGGAGTYERYTVFSHLILETTLNENAPFNALFRNGGFLELSGTLERELAGQHFGLLEAVFYRRMGDITFLPIYTGFSLETGGNWNRYQDINAENNIFAGSVFIGADTFMGPLYVAFGAADNGDKALYFYFGQTFLSED